MANPGGVRRPTKSVLAFLAVLAATSVPISSAPAQELSRDADWDWLQGYIQDAYSADLARIPHIDQDPAALARNLGIFYGYVLGRLGRERGEDPEATARLERLEGLLHTSLIDFVRVSSTLTPTHPGIALGPVLLETRRAMDGAHDAEVEDLLRAIGGRIPTESAPVGDWGPLSEDVAPPEPDPGGAGLADPRRERELGDFEGELPANVVLTGADARQREALVQAVGLGKHAEVRRLLESGTDPNAPDPTTWVTPLMMVQTVAIAADLLRFGADPRRTDRQGATPLHHTIFAEEADRITPLLVAHGADVNTQDDAGHTPLIAAALNRDAEAVALALDWGADPEIRSADGLTAFEYAVELEAEDLIVLLENVARRQEEPE